MATTPNWGPFRDGPDAAARLGGFVDAHLGPDTGIAWYAQGNLVPVRKPMLDVDETGTIVVVEWHDAVPYHPVARGLGQRVEDWFRQTLEAYGRAQIA